MNGYKKKAICIGVLILAFLLVLGTLLLVNCRKEELPEKEESIPTIQEEVQEKNLRQDDFSERMEVEDHLTYQTTEVIPIKKKQKVTPHVSNDIESDSELEISSNPVKSQSDETQTGESVVTEIPSNDQSSDNPKTETEAAPIPDKTADSKKGESTPHTHNWTTQMKTVHHDEKGHYEIVIIKDAYEEQEPVYEEVTTTIYVCTCGQSFSTGEEWDAHNESYVMSDLSAGIVPTGKGDTDTEKHGGVHYEYYTQRVQTGTRTIYHEEKTEQKWVIDQKAYDETIIDGYKCNSCGARK